MKYFLSFVMLFSVGMLYAQEDTVYTEDYEESEYEESDDYEEEVPEETHYPLSPEDVSKRKGYPQESVDVQRFDREKWRKVVGDEDYQEVESKKKKRNSEGRDSINAESANSKKRMHDRFDEGEEEGEEESDPSSSSINIPFLNYIFYALAIGIIGYILFLIIKNTSLKSSTKVAKPADSDPAAPVEDIKELEIDRLLREAMTAGNYRLAIRIYFLGLLKKLDEDGLIVWKKNKTNRDYLTELFIKARYFDEVQRLTLAYEEVWYGDHTFSTQTYEEIISSFKTIDQKLNADRAQ